MSYEIMTNYDINLKTSHWLKANNKRAYKCFIVVFVFIHSFLYNITPISIYFHHHLKFMFVYTFVCLFVWCWYCCFYIVYTWIDCIQYENNKSYKRKANWRKKMIIKNDIRTNRNNKKITTSSSIYSIYLSIYLYSLRDIPNQWHTIFLIRIMIRYIL